MSSLIMAASASRGRRADAGATSLLVRGDDAASHSTDSMQIFSCFLRFGAAALSRLFGRARDPALRLTCTLGYVLVARGCSIVEPESSAQGRLLWHVAGRGSGIDPTTDESTVFFASWNHEAIALEKATGQVRWRTSTGETGSIFVMSANLVVAGDVVVLGDSWIHAFDQLTGVKRWVHAPPDGHQIGAGALATDGELVYAGGSSNRIYAIEAATGAARWTTQLPSLGPGEMKSFVGQVRDGVLYVGSKHLHIPVRGALLALEAATGRILWSHAFEPGFPGAIYGYNGQMAFHGENVIVGVDDGRIHAIDQATGTWRWTAPWVHPLPPAQGGSYGDYRPVAVARDMVVAGSTSGIAVGLDATTGAERWRLSGIYASGDGVSTDGELVFLRTSGGRIYVVDPVRGLIVWQVGIGSTGALQEPFLSAALPDGNRVYATGEHGFFALSR
jgi:outer membrane protein assembly factor BamB